RMLHQRAVLGRACAGERASQQQDALGDLAGEVVLSRGHLALELVAPGAEYVGPTLDRVLPTSGPVDLDRAGPSHAGEMFVDPLHLRLAPVALTGGAVADDGAQEAVAVPEDVGLHGDRVAYAALCRKAASVDRRRRELDLAAGGRLPAISFLRRSRWFRAGSGH